MIRQAGPDQARQAVKPDLDLNCLTLVVFLKVMILKTTSKRQKHIRITQQAKTERRS